jgi:putrescine aminotransferase
MVRDTCIANGLMVRGIRDTIVMCPPLIISHDQIDQMIAIIRRSLDEAIPHLRAGEKPRIEAESDLPLS